MPDDGPKHDREYQAENSQAEPEEALAASQGVPVSYLRGLDRLNLAIREARDLDQMMSDVLDVVLDVMDADRAWLLYPCDPSVPFWRVPMERTRPQYPGALAQGKDLPMLEEVREVFDLALHSDDPLPFGPGTERPLPLETNKPFNVQSQLLTALYPKLDKPWLFGIHQCSRVRIWSRTEQMLFKAMGRRIGDALGSLLLLRGLRTSEGRFRAILDFMPSAIIGLDGQGRITHFNRIAQTIFGKEFQQVTGQPLADALPTLAGQLGGSLAAVLNQGQVMRQEKQALP